MPIQWRNPYDENENQALRDLTAIDFTGDPGKTLQAPAEDVDINVIMKRFGITDGSVLPRWSSPNAIYGDFSDLPDNPVEVAEILRQGEVAFRALPADLRNRFRTGPELYQWLRTPANHEEAIKLGLLKKEKPITTIEDMTQRLETAIVSTSTSSDKE